MTKRNGGSGNENATRQKSRENECSAQVQKIVPSRDQLMAKSRLRDGTEPTVFISEVAKQHDVFVGAIAFGVFALVSGLTEKIRKLRSASTKISQNRHSQSPDCSGQRSR